MKHPLVSVIIPTYNYGCYIREAIDSVLQQNYPLAKIEIIVVDDGSTDNTQQVLKELIDNGTIQYYYQENKGKASATAFAVQKSNGKYIFNLDADDYYLQNKIVTYVKVFESDDSIVHVGAPNKFFYQDTLNYEVENIPLSLLTNAIDGNDLLLSLYNNNIIFGGGSTYAARASVIKQINIPAGVDMYIDEFLLLAVLPFGKSFFVKEPFSVWRVHKSNFSGRALSKEQLLINEERLLKSSNATLEYIKNNNFSDRLTRIYQLIHSIRKISFKETAGNKSFLDIFKYGFDVFFVMQPGWKIIKKYNVLNKMAPTAIIPFVKRMKKSLHANHDL